MRIEQHPGELGKLRMISPEHGANYRSPPIFVGAPEFAALLDKVDSVECLSAFGRFTLRKRRNTRGGKIWYGYVKAGEREYRAGKGSDLTSEVLDSLAIKLYQKILFL